MAEPSVRVLPEERAPISGGWITRFGLLYLGQNLAWAGPAQLLIAVQVAEWFPAAKEARLAWLMAAGGLVSLVATPVAGAISDRTRSRLGRRATWILLGALVAAAALVGMAFAPAYGGLLAGWLVFQLAIAFAINAAQSVPPDQVPVRQYGLVAGVMGLTYTLAVVLGTVVATVLGLRAAYLVTAAMLLLLTAQFLGGFRDPLPPAPVARARGRAAVAPAWRAHADYWWVFLARLLVTLGQAIALFYLFYFLRDRIGHADPETGVLVLTVVYAACVVGTTVLGGRWSDRLGRRKPFVVASSLGLAVAALLMATATSFAVVVVAAMVLGASWGVYMAVDQALINEVLPSGDDRGRDMGIMNLAVAAPNASAPVVAAVALAWLGGYPGLYVTAAVAAVLGAVVLRLVRGVD